MNDKTCDTCEHGNLLGDGDLYCSYHQMTREDYDFSACNDWKGWDDEDE